VKTSKRGNARRGSVGIPSGKTELVDTDSPGAQIPEVAALGRSCWSASSGGPSKNDKRGKRCRETQLATGEGKPLKVEAQGRYPHETRREGFRVEEGAKSLRKVEGAS